MAWKTHDMMIAMCQKDWERSSSPNQNEFDGGRKKETEKIERRERKEKEKGREKEVQHLLVSYVRTSKRFDGSGSEPGCAPRGRGSLLLWLVLV